ncbi:YqxA family protein [Bacillus sp. FJAT-49705]|uniref:YqxA family protein n=2 Tax=Cytobacillus citreus TaxID=2833586 RepID=A0ABS5NU51_9BACI|nr:YqxA family protein [Cytobacillus citreus]MBS4191360.1 YqxA family protein [Cytobacillus citreus]
MKWFMLKSFILVSLMFMAVLFGMQQANEGIQNMKGYHDSNLKGAFTFQEGKDGQVQASILGKDVSSHDLQQKKEKLEEMKSFNFFSTVGKKLSEGISNLSESTITFITDLITGN